MENRAILGEGMGLRKDSEKFLEIILKKREQDGRDIIISEI